MKLQVMSSVQASTSKTQKISAHYNPDKNYTCVACDVDVVTLGIVINVLQELFDKAVSCLEPEMVEDIKNVTRKAVIGA